MPYRAEQIKLPENLDRRRKLTDGDRQEIRELYATGLWSLNKLAQKYGVSKKLILLTVNPESAERAKQYRKDHWREWQRKGEERNAAVREHRAYKHKLLEEGLIKPEDDNMVKTKFAGMQAVIEANKAAGHHFFDEGAMEFWGSKIESPLFPNNCFVTSEDNFDRSKRLYTIRRFDPAKGSIDDASEFQAYSTKEEAVAAAKLM